MTTKLFKKLFSFSIAFIVFANAMQAQTRTITGKVMSAANMTQQGLLLL